ncbi:uncharacterized protein LOC130907513 [Corythoichthys intestinalis]|uniref:uncharacterized protein LOC130907513 n=1 Tax=Corythoichthys intestinalis TaxID=161448 RepID=UPI0025A4E834|nr:uncharacterized protein LOC130907513 [Corythoichthys intestinalis]
MESSKRCHEEFFLAKLTVAVAVSVIRSRPAGVCIRQHVQSLAAKLKQRERTASRAKEAGGAHCLPVTVGENTSTSGHNVPTELLGPVPPPAERFPHLLCALQRMDAPWPGDVLPDALRGLTDALAEATRECRLPAGAGQLALEACSRAADLSSGNAEGLEASLTDLIAALRRAGPRHPTADLLSECLVVLGRSRAANSFLFVAVLSEASELAERLCHAVQENTGVADFPADEYHMAWRLLTIAEELPKDAPVARRHRVRLEQTLRQLERQMLALWQEFPLLAVAVWRMVTDLWPSDT